MRNNILAHRMVQKWFARYQIMSCELIVVVVVVVVFVVAICCYFKIFFFPFRYSCRCICVFIFLFSINVATKNNKFVIHGIDRAALCSAHIFYIESLRCVSVQLNETTEMKHTLNHTKQRTDAYQFVTCYFFNTTQIKCN